MKAGKTGDIAWAVWPFAVSGILLTVMQPPFSWWWFGWVCMVPFVCACRPEGKGGQLAAAAYVISVFYWSGNLYWIFPVTWLGWLAFCLYTALLWPVLVFGVRYCRRKKIPLFIAVPILVVGAERLQGLFLGGFFWRFLGHSQYSNIELIQIADIFGAGGVSFVVGMVNGLAADLIISVGQKKILKISNFVGVAVVVAAVVGAVSYGRWRVEQSEAFITDGPVVASLQSNVPQSVKESSQASEEIFADLMESSKEAVKAGSELIIWPETMVQATLDASVLMLLDPLHSYRIYDEALREHAKDKAFVLVGSYGGEARIEEDFTIRLVKKYNSAFLYGPDGQQSRQQYHKIHLVPFGEVVPFRESAAWLHKVLMKFTPYDYDYSLDYGSEYTVFEMTESGGEQSYRFSVMICYEDTVPAIARRFTREQKGQKQIDWLVNISNDGWFVRFKGGEVLPSTELSQHTAICVFRAVENRLCVVRSVNTGVSCLIDSLGRIRDGYSSGSEDFEFEAMERRGVAGWFADKVPIDRRVTFFSKYGQWLDFCCAVCLVVVIIVPPVRRFDKRRRYKAHLSRRPNAEDVRES